jgi:hypothetical protein
VKPDSAPGRLGRCDQLFDRFEDGGELLVLFLLKGFDLAGEIAVRIHQSAQLHKSAHDCDVHFNRAGAPEYTGKHGDALFGKGVRRELKNEVRGEAGKKGSSMN